MEPFWGHWAPCTALQLLHRHQARHRAAYGLLLSPRTDTHRHSPCTGALLSGGEQLGTAEGGGWAEVLPYLPARAGSGCWVTRETADDIAGEAGKLCPRCSGCHRRCQGNDGDIPQVSDGGEGNGRPGDAPRLRLPCPARGSLPCAGWARALGEPGGLSLHLTAPQGHWQGEDEGASPLETSSPHLGLLCSTERGAAAPHLCLSTLLPAVPPPLPAHFACPQRCLGTQ